MLRTSIIEIIHLEEIDGKVLQFQLNVDWTIDDASVITQQILSKISAEAVETIQGADIYCVRFKYGVNELLLNIEEYSHACWLECVTEQDIAALQAIKVLLS